jgi:hypothetical protein
LPRVGFVAAAVRSGYPPLDLGRLRVPNLPVGSISVYESPIRHIYPLTRRPHANAINDRAGKIPISPTFGTGLNICFSRA